MIAPDPLIASAIAAAVPLTLAAQGELVAERAGVLNLGVEGMMLVGALASFVAVAHGGGLAGALLAGIVAGMLASAVFGVLALTLQASQVAAGLSLTILGTGLSAFLGRGFVGFPAPVSFAELPIPGLSRLPLVGPLFSMHALGYAAVALTMAIAFVLGRTRLGLVLRTVGESPATAHALGLPVSAVRWGATLFGGAMAGLAGCCYAVAQFKMWQDGLTAGNGWIALALVVFAGWRPVRVAAGAVLFGGVTALGLAMQAVGVQVSSFALACLPYVATIVVLVMASARGQGRPAPAPAALGRPFFAGD